MRQPPPGDRDSCLRWLRDLAVVFPRSCANRLKIKWRLVSGNRASVATPSRCDLRQRIAKRFFASGSASGAVRRWMHVVIHADARGGRASPRAPVREQRISELHPAIHPSVEIASRRALQIEVVTHNGLSVAPEELARLEAVLIVVRIISRRLDLRWMNAWPAVWRPTLPVRLARPAGSGWTWRRAADRTQRSQRRRRRSCAMFHGVRRAGAARLRRDDHG